jgi:hypothetical protein
MHPGTQAWREGYDKPMSGGVDEYKILAFVWENLLLNYN